MVAVECAETEARCDLVARERATGAELGRAPISPEQVTNYVAGAAPGVLAPDGSALATLNWVDVGNVRLAVARFDGQPPFSVDRLEFSYGGTPVAVSPPAITWLGDDVVCGLDVASSTAQRSAARHANRRW